LNEKVDREMREREFDRMHRINRIISQLYFQAREKTSRDF